MSSTAVAVSDKFHGNKHHLLSFTSENQCRQGVLSCHCLQKSLWKCPICPWRIACTSSLFFALTTNTQKNRTGSAQRGGLNISNFRITKFKIIFLVSLIDRSLEAWDVNRKLNLKYRSPISNQPNIGKLLVAILHRYAHGECSVIVYGNAVGTVLSIGMCSIGTNLVNFQFKIFSFVINFTTAELQKWKNFNGRISEFWGDFFLQ